MKFIRPSLLKFEFTYKDNYEVWNKKTFESKDYENTANSLLNIHKDIDDFIDTFKKYNSKEIIMNFNGEYTVGLDNIEIDLGIIFNTISSEKNENSQEE